MPEERILVLATYIDLPRADSDHGALHRWHADHGVPQEFDAVTLGRRSSGEVRFHLGQEQVRGSDGSPDANVSLAAGLAAALFPSAWADAPTSLWVQRSILGAVAGEVARAFGRAELMVLGSFLDESASCLIVATRRDHGAQVRGALGHAGDVLSRSTFIDIDRIRRVSSVAAVISR